LAGATQRLNRQELADAIVYPSKVVQDRFKATEVITTNAGTLSGFVTEQTNEFVSITDVQGQVTRLPRGQVKAIRTQEQSLMPAKLLNALKKEEIIDLMTFIHEMK
jgi:putative heme-binding domain-containing protein